MTGNQIGKIVSFSSFGESHGPAIGGIIDGFPSNFSINFEKINQAVSRRSTNQSKFSSSRNEADTIEFLSGIFEGKTLGTPIAFIIRNKDAKSNDYEHLKDIYRPSHADFTYESKYGIRDYRGGGRSSARETVARVVAGEIANQYLQSIGISIQAFVSSIGHFSMTDCEKEFTFEEIESSPVRCPDPIKTKEIVDFLAELQHENDSAGGIICCNVIGVPVGLGEPIFDKLHADLAKAMMSINAVKGFEIGAGFSSATLKGSEYNELFKIENNQIKTKTNQSGGIQGGISNGMKIQFKVAFKPVSSIGMEQEVMNKDKELMALKIGGRHDVCVVPRAVPIVESMAAIVILDHYLRQKVYQL